MPVTDLEHVTPPATGETIATKTIDGKDVQVVLPIWGDTASGREYASPTTPIPMGVYDTSGNQLDPAVEATLTGTPTLGTAANSVLDAMHAAQMVFSSAALVAGGRGTILGASLRDQGGDTTSSIRLVLFHKSVSAQTAQTALAISDTDVIERVGYLDFTTWVNGGATASFAVAERATLPLPYKCDSGTSDLFGFFQQLVGTPTKAATDFSVDLEVLKSA